MNKEDNDELFVEYLRDIEGSEEYLKAGIRDIHHSRSYNENYHPHYRLIKRNYAFYYPLIKRISDWKYEADVKMYKNKGRMKRI